ncbi:MAG: hypothetical protein AUJ20_07395 [Comamonadaceae bacterium CG1_02_60_18]|nr:MAG: hypothetical protein AUJ20_07395 [Comamonadaceae bacterium CG1_02_60_18]
MNHRLRVVSGVTTWQAPAGSTLRRRFLLGATALAGLSLAGCASQSLDSYASQQPALDLRDYFNGTFKAYGIFTDRSGTVVKRFTVLMQCSWQGDEGVLDESFTYSDGSTQKRVWHLTHLGEGRYSGRADDVVGSAAGQTRGNAFHWAYTLALPVDGTVYEVQFDDWMYLMGDGVMLNKARMSKFGVHLGDVTLAFTKN